MNANYPPFVIACPPMKNNKNVSMIARSASCFGADKIIITGQNRVDKHISRDCNIIIEHHNSILPVISKYKMDGYRIVGLEQHPKSIKMQDYLHEPQIPTLLLVGNECRGMDQDIINCLDYCVEIQLLNKPKSLNVAVAASIFLFEYSVMRIRERCNENAIN